MLKWMFMAKKYLQVFGGSSLPSKQQAFEKMEEMIVPIPDGELNLEQDIRKASNWADDMFNGLLGW